MSVRGVQYGTLCGPVWVLRHLDLPLFWVGGKVVEGRKWTLLRPIVPFWVRTTYERGRGFAIIWPCVHGWPRMAGGGFAYTKAPSLRAGRSAPECLSYICLLSVRLEMMSLWTTLGSTISAFSSKGDVGKVVRVRRENILCAGEYVCPWGGVLRRCNSAN